MTAKENTAIEVRGLTKTFGDVIAVAGINFDVQEGELFGFLGPNGAGKSTTINVLIGLARPDAGTIHINGIDCVPALLPGVIAVSVLFGTTSLLAVTVTFEKKGRSFERLLLAPIPLELLMLAKTAGAIFFWGRPTRLCQSSSPHSSRIFPAWRGSY